MNGIAHHPRPCIPPSPNGSTIDVDLSEFGIAGRFEQLNVEPSPIGHYVVACLPFFTYGIHFGDLIEVCDTGRRFVRVRSRSGLRTMRIAINEQKKSAELHQSLHAAIVNSGLPHEFHGAGYACVLLRCIEDQDRVLSCLKAAISNDQICWEVDSEPFVQSTEPGM